MNRFSSFSLLLLTLIFSACSKDTNQSTSLQISVKQLGPSTPVSGATVKLYIENSGIIDWNNAIATQVSNSQGDAFFADLSPAEYHWIAEKGCSSSYHNFTQLGPITANTINYGGTYIAEKTTLHITNNTSETYTISGSRFLQSGISITANNTFQGSASIGLDTIHMVSFSNPLNRKDTILNFTCGVAHNITCQ